MFWPNTSNELVVVLENEKRDKSRGRGEVSPTYDNDMCSSSVAYVNQEEVVPFAEPKLSLGLVKGGGEEEATCCGIHCIRALWKRNDPRNPSIQHKTLTPQK